MIREITLKQSTFGLIFCLVVVFVGLFALPSITQAATHYVNNSQGTDDPAYGTGIGTDAWATLKYALTGSRVAKGDTIYVEGGTWSEDQINVAVAAGDGNPVVVQNYNGESVTIQTGTVSQGLFFINGIDMTFDGINIDNNNVAMSSKFLFGLYSTSTTVDLIFQNATIDGTNPSGNIRLFKLYGSQPHNLTINKADMINTGIVIETAGTGASNNNVNVYSSLMREGYVGFFSSTTGATSLTLKNTLWGRFTGYVMLLDSSNTTLDAHNNIFVGGGSYDRTIFSFGADFVTEALSDNSIFDLAYNYFYSEDSPFVTATYNEIYDSTQVVPYMPKQNWFVDPNFTSLGTDWTLASGSLIAQRGTNDHPTDGTDINGVAYGTNDVGPYVNPTLTALAALDTSEVAWHGDSIVNGTGASSSDNQATAKFEDYTGETAVEYGEGGLFSRGAFWTVDQSIFTGRESTAILAVGINDLASPRAAQTNAQVSDTIQAAMEKLEDAGIAPVFLGVTSEAGNPPANTDPNAITANVQTECTSQGWSCGSIISYMEDNASWKTEYYSDLTTDVHPDNDGHAVLARLGEYVYSSKGTMGTNEVDIGAGARVFADGEFRALGTTSGSTADFTVTPVGGVGSYDSADKSAYMDVTINTWQFFGDKEWVSDSSSGTGFTQAGTTVFTIGDLMPNSRYTLTVDGAASADVTGSTCSGSSCWSDGAGQIEFTYSGGYSSHTFALVKAPASSNIIVVPEINYEVEILALNGAEDLEVGQEYEITWEASPENVYYIDLYYSDGNAYQQIAKHAENDGSYTWTPTKAVSNSVIRLVWTDLAEELASDESDATFNIIDLASSEEVEDDSNVAEPAAEKGISPVTGEEEEITAVAAGDYIRSSYFPTIYYIDEIDGVLTRRPFMNRQTFYTYQDDFSNVIAVTDATLTSMRLGRPMLPNPGVVLIKIQSDPKVYAVDGDGIIRWIQTEEVAKDLYGEGWADYVIDIAATFFPRFTRGYDVAESSDIELPDVIMKERVQLIE